MSEQVQILLPRGISLNQELELRKKKVLEHVNHERWQFIIMFLFAFFIMMYSIPTVDSQKSGRMVASVRASFSSPVFAPGSRDLSLSKGDGEGAALSKDLIENVKSADKQAGANLGLKADSPTVPKFKTGISDIQKKK
jgi:hypothetical protein